MVTIAADSESTNDQRIKDAFFIVQPNQEQLIEIGQQLDAGRLKAFVSGVVALNEASVAYSGTLKEKRGYGKVVISISGISKQMPPPAKKKPDRDKLKGIANLFFWHSLCAASLDGRPFAPSTLKRVCFGSRTS